MKLTGLSLIAATIAIAAPATAQMRHVEVQRTVTTTSVHDEHRVVRHNGRHKVCKTQWRHHHKVRNCWWTR
jgi:hypothetical protein